MKSSFQKTFNIILEKLRYALPNEVGKTTDPTQSKLDYNSCDN